ncbi:methylenetetrahydrofolate reductase [candidate division WOR-3 bacterium]|nr:methylenetetrahydrofolate reductase [candidate division WOR-3 bacterium]
MEKDIKKLRKKIEAGVSFIINKLFYKTTIFTARWRKHTG